MRERLRAAVRGAVQGVGFRPFVYRLATGLGLDGWVLNGPQGVLLEVEGERPALDRFLGRLTAERPPRAVIQGLEHSWLDPVPLAGFTIRESTAGGETTALVLPDVATCDDCRRELLDPGDRRHRYPFTNCTNCGPRYTIVEALPYDRAQTSMRRFVMCAACQSEYDDPDNRRFHAQPNACPVCGPQLALWNADGGTEAEREAALGGAGEAIRRGLVVAVKGLGGFHLIVDARQQAAVARLRARKHREEKPFALMYSSLDEVERDCVVSAAEARLLVSPESPIVLVRRRPAPQSGLDPSVAPGNPCLGVMLPYTPLHHLLLQATGGPLVATSGNLSDEPICTDETEAVARLRGVADLFLVHDRPIVRHVDDSIVRIVAGRELVMRRARGYAPLPVPLGAAGPPVVALGAHLKSAVAVTAGENAFISQHIGDLETRQAADAFDAVLESLERLYHVRPVAVLADLHPDYYSTRRAQTLGPPVVQIQHHYAHVAACMAENALEGPVLGVAWDGTGLGLDGTIWGGEFLLTTRSGFERVACLRPFRLPGGDRAAREPRRSALGVLAALVGDAAADRLDLPPIAAFTDAERRLLRQALARGVNAPITTSAGRLFDAVASLAGLHQRSSFEGQAAMALEFAVDDRVGEAYPLPVQPPGAVGGLPDGWSPPALVVDWRPAIEGVIGDVRHGAPAGTISARFHHGLVEAVVGVARHVGERRVVLTGGCFQNRWLVERAISRLRQDGFRPYWHQRVPPNDGGIALGQVAAWLRSRGAAADAAPPLPRAP